MTEVLTPHGISPSGRGIVLVDGELYPSSSCCGNALRDLGTFTKCMKCLDTHPPAPKEYARSLRYPWTYAERVIAAWIAGWTGYNPEEIGIEGLTDI